MHLCIILLCIILLQGPLSSESFASHLHEPGQMVPTSADTAVDYNDKEEAGILKSNI